MTHHYVYKLIDPLTNEFYIGSRSCKCKVEDDTYMGSPKRWKPIDKKRLKKEIVKKDFITREDAIQFEATLIKEYINDEYNRNYHIPGTSFHSFQKINIYDDVFKEKIRKTLKEYYKHNSPPFKGRTHSPQSKHLISIRKTGIKMDESFKQTRKEYMLGDKNPMFGKQHLLSTKEKISNRKKGVRIVKNCRIIHQLDMNQNFIKEWASITDAAKMLGISKGHICMCCKGKKLSFAGFIWRYKESSVV